MALTAKKVEKLMQRGEPGKHPDGDGLYLIVVRKGVGHWEKRYQLNGVERYMGKGSAKTFSLKEARERNREDNQLLASGIDPLAEKRARKAAQLAAAATKLSFRRACEAFVAQHDAKWSNAKHAAEYASSLRRYAWPHLGEIDVAEIGVPHVLAVLEQEVEAYKGYPAGKFWHARTVSADRLRNRIETVLNWCAARGHRPQGVPNPAAWSHLQYVLPPPSKIAPVHHHRAIGYQEIPALMAELAQRQGVAVKALMFVIMTACRSGEALGATWNEVNFAEKMWTVPAERMKGRREHRVPLAPQVLELLQSLPREADNPFLFIGTHKAALGNAAMSATLQRLGYDVTTHGMRSAFADWAHETATAFSNHTIELSLAHSVGTEVERSYRRSDLVAKRRQLMTSWAQFCCSPTVAGKVLPLRGTR